MKNLNTPILFLVFNRPDKTKLVFETIRKAKPKRLFVAADGPRTKRANENETCGDVREIATNIDWDCELKTLFRDENLGCGIAVSEAITWFIEHVEEGIILEDDCLPNESFFPFCTELLEKYRFDGRIMMISGNNLLGREWKSNSQSYFFGHPGVWGWATWKRAWKDYDYKMIGWEDRKIQNTIKAGLTKIGFQTNFKTFSDTFKGAIDTWDVQWAYSILVKKGLCINPSVNLVKNTGFGKNATHTFNADSYLSDIPTAELTFPLLHPNKIVGDKKYIKLMYETINNGGNLPSRFYKLIRVLNTTITAFKLQFSGRIQKFRLPLSRKP